MKLLPRLIAFLLVAAWLSGCGALPRSGGRLPTQAPASPTPDASETPLAQPSATSTASAVEPILRIWLPPFLDPETGGLEASLLQDHLRAFFMRHPGLKMDVRVKALDGPGGMLDALSATRSAAPGALPDLVALPRPLLESAALKGLLHPYDGLSDALEDPDWYPYARELGRLQNSVYGLPFAGDALVMPYRPSLVAEAPITLTAVSAGGLPFAFATPESQAGYLIALYLSAGGTVQDSQGRPALDAQVLTKVLAALQEAATKGALPSWTADLISDDQAWIAFSEGQAALGVTWFSHFLNAASPAPAETQTPDLSLAAIPTLDGAPYTLADGWVWALAGGNSENQALAAELAAHLTDPQFLARWSAEAGYLPTRRSAQWPGGAERDLASQLAESAQLLPPSDVVAAVAPYLRQAFVNVVVQGIAPDIAAQEAALRLQNP